MKYEKPELLELGERARATNVRGFRACISGATATALETCATGTGADWSCVPGNGNALTYISCVPGGAPNGDCLSGGSAAGDYCEIGTSGGNDPNGCDMGPSFA